MRHSLKSVPYAEPGMKIGLLGGSFNPPHEGHVDISEMILKKAGLDKVWWMITPGNPWKDPSQLSCFLQRYAACRRLLTNPKIAVTGFEVFHTFHYTQETLSHLRMISPRLKFVWLMGADNLASFHLWQKWQQIASLMPMVVFDRPGSTFSVSSAPAALALQRFWIKEENVGLINCYKPPVWTFLHGRKNIHSSTAIRGRFRGDFENG